MLHVGAAFYIRRIVSCTVFASALDGWAIDGLAVACISILER